MRKFTFPGCVLLEAERPIVTKTAEFSIEVELGEEDRSKLLALFENPCDYLDYHQIEEELPELYERMDVEAMRVCQKEFAYQPIFITVRLPRKVLEGMQ